MSPLAISAGELSADELDLLVGLIGKIRAAEGDVVAGRDDG
jgi:hypothetical protein